MPRVTVVIVTWNSERHLPACLGSLRRQNFADFVVQMIDNASSDASVNVAREFFPECRVRTNLKNVGFCRGVNQGCRMARSEFVLVLNPDVILEPACLKLLVELMDRHPRAGSVGPKLLAVAPEDIEGDFTAAHDPVLDAAGLQVLRSRRAVNRGEGQNDCGQYDRTEPVFGCPGACALYRKRSLEDIAVSGEYFDKSFFAYKDDVDVAWRLRLRGYEAWYHHQAVAHHGRSLRAGKPGMVNRLRARWRMPRRLRALSFRNQLLMLAKNEQRENFLRDAAPIFLLQAGYVLRAAVVEPFLLAQLLAVARQLPQTWRKRRIIQHSATVSPQEMRKWFVSEAPNSLPLADPPQEDKHRTKTQLNV